MAMRTDAWRWARLAEVKASAEARAAAMERDALMRELAKARPGRFTTFAIKQLQGRLAAAHRAYNAAAGRLAVARHDVENLR